MPADTLTPTAVATFGRYALSARVFVGLPHVAEPPDTVPTSAAWSVASISVPARTMLDPAVTALSNDSDSGDVCAVSVNVLACLTAIS